MRKGRYSFLLLIFLFYCLHVKAQDGFAKAQVDTLHHRGFRDYQEAADSLYSRLLSKKPNSVREFTVDEKTFIAETRKVDTVIAIQMIHGQYTFYWGQVERSYNKLHKKLQSRKIRAEKTKKDTVLLYPNYGNGVQRAELYIKQKKYQAYIKYQLWQVNGLWYFTGKFEVVEQVDK
ncbi:MAG: hypothetical protein KG003_06400 [Bacteroidetes bacterium]|nr:hypothetical protein [Bacteroidota bacterium]